MASQNQLDLKSMSADDINKLINEHTPEEIASVTQNIPRDELVATLMKTESAESASKVMRSEMAIGQKIADESQEAVQAKELFDEMRSQYESTSTLSIDTLQNMKTMFEDCIAKNKTKLEMIASVESQFRSQLSQEQQEKPVMAGSMRVLREQRADIEGKNTLLMEALNKCRLTIVSQFPASSLAC